jgi:hypothetical protein
MSNLLSQASLVMIPSGYKEDVVYSAVPTNGNGDLSFTRASNGTRINSAGLVEVCPWNLLEQSNTFSTSPWANTNVILTSGQTDPNGGATAFRAQFSGVSYLLQNLTALNGTNSIYAKAYGSTAKIRLCDPNGSFGTQYNLTTEWQRITTSGNALAGISIDSYIDGGWTSQDIVIAFAQTNIGSTAKPYFPTTDRLNVPRLTYQNGGGGCPSLLLEKQSTNEALESNTLTTNPNVVDFSTTTANVYVSPDGTQNAMRFTETTNNNRHGFYQYTTVTAQTYTASIFTKQTGRRYISFDSDITGTSATSFFDLQTISVVSSGSGHTCSIQDFGNGWLRLIVTFTASAGARYVIWGGSPNGTTNSYAGSTSISQTFYGYQLEASSYPTSYIPTTSASATRVADACFKTGISSLIGGGVGTWFMDFEFIEDTISNYTFAFNLSDGTITNHLYLYYNNPSWYWGGVDTAITLPSTLRKKVAIKYSSGTGKLFCNGSLISTLSISSSFSRLDIGNRFSQNYPMDGKINEAYFLTTSLTDAECQALTTI